MSDASDEIQVDAPVEVEAPTEAPKGKLSVEDALQVRPSPSLAHSSNLHVIHCKHVASPQERSRP